MNVSTHSLIYKIAFIVCIFLGGEVSAYEETKEPEKKCLSQFTFSWSLHEECGLRPRGGTTKGNKVELESVAHDGWLALKKPSLSQFERDRQAILAMAGAYRTSFDFLETVGYTQNYKPKRPYQSWGTETVYVIEERKNFISLQHIMVMFFEQEDGGLSGPMVMKHWRQDWQYEKRQLLEYQGDNIWKTRKLSRKDVKGTWAQSVYQVDDSPRYESFGSWEHKPNFSSWISATTWRPLPRREHSVRDDYHVLEGTNRHTIVPTGWVHEQENYKVALDSTDENAKQKRYVAKEIGLNRYEKIINHDFSAGDQYWEETQAFWSDVRTAWADLANNNKRFKLRKKVDKQALYMALFTGANQFKGKQYDSEKSKAYLEDIIENFQVRLPNKKI